MNLLIEFILPWRLLNCFKFLGGGIITMALTFLGSIYIPRLETMNPNNLPKVTPNAHF